MKTAPSTPRRGMAPYWAGSTRSFTFRKASLAKRAPSRAKGEEVRASLIQEEDLGLSLRQLQGHVAGEAVGDHHLGGPQKDVPALHVAKKALPQGLL